MIDPSGSAKSLRPRRRSGPVRVGGALDDRQCCKWVLTDPHSTAQAKGGALVNGLSADNGGAP
jgi:hypothetical protein